MMASPRLTSKGFNTSAIFGFTNTIISILKNEKPTHFAIAFDTPEPTDRHRLFPDYKAQRETIPEDLLASLPAIRQVAAAFNVPVLLAPGYEADDIIGTLAKRADAEGVVTYMVTAVTDLSPLVIVRIFL
jgi:DNA polymerase-1